jgi:hypothetical protein
MCHGKPEKKLTRRSLEKFIPEFNSNAGVISPPEMGGHSYNRAEEAKQMAAQAQNGRSQKSAAIHYEGPALIVRPRDIQIPPGTMVKARLTSGGGNARVKAVLLESVIAQGETLIEQGSTFLGQGSSTEDRLTIQFTKLINRDGSVNPIHAEADDLSDKSAGLKGSVVSSRGGKLAASIGLNFISGATEALQDSEGQFGATIHPPNVKDAALQGTAQASLEQSREMMDEMKNTKIEVRVPDGTDFYLLFTDEGK